MSTERRLSRLIELRRRAVEDAERLLATRRLEAQSAQGEEAASARRYAAALGAADAEQGSAWDTGYGRAHLMAARDEREARTRATQAATAAEREAEGRVVDARRELRKLELMEERRALEVTMEQARVERRLVDELAARGRR